MFLSWKEVWGFNSSKQLIAFLRSCDCLEGFSACSRSALRVMKRVANIISIISVPDSGFKISRSLWISKAPYMVEDFFFSPLSLHFP